MLLFPVIAFQRFNSITPRSVCQQSEKREAVKRREAEPRRAEGAAKRQAQVPRRSRSPIQNARCRQREVGTRPAPPVFGDRFAVAAAPPPADRFCPLFRLPADTPAAFGSFSSVYPLPPRNSPGVIPVTALNCLINWYSLA